MSRETWPHLMRELAECVGPRLTLEIVKRWGGVANTQIPRRLETWHPFREIVPDEAWARVVQRLGGWRGDVPRGQFLELKKLTILEMAEREPGLGYATIARRAGCTERYVRSILGRPRHATDARQLDLFKD